MALQEEGHAVTEAADAEEGLARFRSRRFNVVVSDIKLPGMDGLQLFEEIRKEAPQTDVILMTGFAEVSDAVAALRNGARHYVTKPFDCEHLARKVVGQIAQERALSPAAAPASGTPLIGASPLMRKLAAKLDSVAQSEAPVLITGESGTGKEVLAQALHQRSSRALGPFVALNCAAVPESLMESELFGHEKGAFTGAHKRRDGKFKAAHGGTLLLDEVADLPLSAQAKLLRALQEGVVEPLGSNTPVPVDVRVVSATHKNLKALIQAKLFREDLYFRLNVIDLHLPALRERRGDLPLLFEHFVKLHSAPGRRISISPRAWAALSEYAFPGNVRELSHAVERALVLAGDSEIDLEHLPPDIVGAHIPQDTRGVPFRPLADAMAEFERAYLLRALQKTQGQRAKTAELLGISRKNLWEKLKAHGLSDEDVDGQAVGRTDA